MTDTKGIIALMCMDGISSQTVKFINDRLKIESSDTTVICEKLRKAGRLNHKIREYGNEDIVDAVFRAEGILERCSRLGIDITLYTDSQYPKELITLKDAPAVLYSRGNIELLNDVMKISIIGCRNASTHSLSVASRLGSIFAENGYTVISGLAEGCDEAAHLGCLRVGGNTVAVLPSGIDNIYPVSNRILAEEIVRKGGCLISEYPPGTKVFRGSFIKRDRITAAFGAATVAVSLGEYGGTMQTIRIAEELGKITAFYMASNKFFGSDEYSGNRKLLSEGCAVPITEIYDIFRLMELIRNERKEHVQMTLF